MSPKVVTLFNTLLTPGMVAGVERMEGGGYNRVIGVTMAHGKRYVLRIPRCCQPIHHEIADQVAIIRHVEKNSSIPVPEVIHFDVENRNPIQAPYMIQTRLEGVSLSDVIGSLQVWERKKSHNGDCAALNQNLRINLPDCWSTSRTRFAYC